MNIRRCLRPLAHLVLAGCFCQVWAQTSSQFRIQYLDLENTADPARFQVLTVDFLDLATAATDSDTSAGGVRISDTHWFNKVFGIELGASYLGQYTTHIQAQDHPYKVVSVAYSGQLGPVVRWTFFDSLDVFARVSAMYWREERELWDLDPAEDENGDAPFNLQLNVRSDTDVDVEWEAGLTYDFTYSLGITASALQFDLGDQKFDAVTVGLSLRY